MANTIKIKRGTSADISKLTLSPGEIAATLDNQLIYIGDSTGAVKPINAEGANRLLRNITINGQTFDGTESITISTDLNPGAHISITDGTISVSDIGSLGDLTTGSKDTIVNALNELVNVDSQLVGNINTVQNNLTNATTNLQTQINGIISGGITTVDTLYNNLMSLNEDALSVGTPNTKVQVIANGAKLEVANGPYTLFKVGPNNETGNLQTEAETLVVTGNLFEGYHQVKKFTRNGEKRTGWFYVGGE